MQRFSGDRREQVLRWDTIQYVPISAHLRPGSQVKLLFVPPFQRLIILHEHAV